MIIFFAGAKEETKSEPFSDPRVAVGQELNLMTTFDELRKSLHLDARQKFLKGLRRRRRTGKSGKIFWTWYPGYEGRIKIANTKKCRIRVLIPTKELVQEPQKLLVGKKAERYLQTLKEPPRGA